MIIRPIKQADLSDLRILYIELCDKDRSLASIQRGFEKIEKNEMYHLLGAEVDGKIVGSLMGVVCYDLAGEDKYFMTLENVIVSEAYRGKGICKALFNEIEAIAKQNNCEYIYFVSGKQRTVAHEAYSKFGYTEEGAKGFRKHL